VLNLRPVKDRGGDILFIYIVHFDICYERLMQSLAKLAKKA